MKVLHVITRMIVGGAQENTLYNCLDLMRLYGDIHRRLVEQISAMSDEDLARPYREYQPTSNGEWPVSRSIAGNTYEHYLEEHRAWMDAIINSGS